MIDTMSLSADTFLVGAFNLAASILDRLAPTVTIATQHADDFVRNKVTVLCENRVGLMVTRPAAIVRGSVS